MNMYRLSHHNRRGDWMTLNTPDLWKKTALLCEKAQLRKEKKSLKFFFLSKLSFMLLCNIKLWVFHNRATDDSFHRYKKKQPLNEDVVYRPAFAIHADLYALTFQRFNIKLTGKLAALVRVDDLWLAMRFNSL